jgi:hypothetical protein
MTLQINREITMSVMGMIAKKGWCETDKNDTLVAFFTIEAIRIFINSKGLKFIIFINCLTK